MRQNLPRVEHAMRATDVFCLSLFSPSVYRGSWRMYVVRV